MNATGQANNTIVFLKGAQPLQGTISLQKALPAINKNVTIPGQDNIVGLITIQGNANAGNLYSIFSINRTVTAEIDALYIQGGYAEQGGGVFNSGKLTLKNDLIQYNTATKRGGGIYNGGSGAALTLNGTTIYKNDCDGSGGGGVWNSANMSNNDTGGVATSITFNTTTGLGGGIYNLGDVWLTGASVGLNEADMTSGRGGGVFNGASGTFTMDNGTLNGNQANQGGGVYNLGQIALQMGTMVEDNTANQGGGIFLAQNSITTINNVTVSGNILEGNNAAAKGIGFLNPCTKTINGLTDNDDPGGKPVQLN